MAKGDNTAWVELPLLQDWEIAWNSSNVVGIYDGSSEATQGWMAGNTFYIKSRLVNVVPRKQADKWVLQIRPTMQAALGFAKGAAVNTPRGIFYHEQLRFLVELWGTTAYVNTSDDTYATVASMGATTEGPGGAASGIDSSGTQYMFVSTQSRSFTAVAAAPVTTTIITDADFPTSVVPTPIFMDSYIFIPQAGTRNIYNCEAGAPTSWTASGFIRTEETGGNIVGLVKHHKYIVAFCEDHIEFFKNAAIPAPNSPLQRDSEKLIQIGCINRATISTHGDITIFVGRDTQGRVGVYKLENYQVTEISNSSIASFMEKYGGVGLRFGQSQTWTLNQNTGTTFATGYVCSFYGKLVYILTCNAGMQVDSGTTDGNIPPSWYYDFETKLWIELAMFHKSTGNTTQYLSGGWPLPYGTFFNTTDTTQYLNKFLFQNVYGGPDDENICGMGAGGGITAEVFDTESTFGWVNESSYIPVAIQWPLTDMDIVGLKTISGLTVNIDSASDSPSTIFDSTAAAMDSGFYRYGQYLQAGDGAIAIRKALIDSELPTSETVENHVYYRYNGGKFYRNWFLLQFATVSSRHYFAIGKVALRITAHDEQ